MIPRKMMLAFALLFVASFMIVPARAKPFHKEVITEIIDGPFPPDASDPNVYGKGVMHRTVIVKGWNPDEGTVSATLLSTVEVRLYQLIPVDDGFEPGEFLFLLKITQVYEGTLVPGIPGGGMVTGTMVMDWVINVVGDVPFPTGLDLRGHWVTLYVDGEPAKQIGFGEFPLG